MKLKEYKPIIQKIERREQIKHERDELEASAQDPRRLLSKSSGSQNLLREEKVRRMVQKELPKIEQELKETLSEWEAMYGQPFLYHGEHYLQVIEKDAAWEQEKKDKMKAARVCTSNLCTVAIGGLTFSDLGPLPQSPHGRRRHPQGAAEACLASDHSAHSEDASRTHSEACTTHALEPCSLAATLLLVKARLVCMLYRSKIHLEEKRRDRVK